MIFPFVLIILIFLIFFNSIIYNSMYKCPPYPLKINYVRASRLPNHIIKEKPEINTIRLKLDRDVPCGIYDVSTLYGKGQLFVGSSNYRIGYLYLKDLVSIAQISMFDLWSLRRLESDTDHYIRTYNRGCC
jgi:hypothetical protein